jgi:hypothetical protein
MKEATTTLTRAGKRMLQMPFIEPSHPSQITAWRRIDRSTVPLEKFCWPDDRPPMVSIDHRFTLASPMRPSAPTPKSIFSACGPIFAEVLQTRCRRLFLNRCRGDT